MLPGKDVGCPYTGFKMKCFVGVTKHRCPKWTRVQGRHPQTGEMIDRYDCSDAILPLLLIENSKLLNEKGAAVESLRNVVARGLIPDHAPLLDDNRDQRARRADGALLPVRKVLG